MPSFDAGAVVEALDYDFTGKKLDGTPAAGWPRALAKEAGTIAEPSDAAIGRFLDGLKKLYAEAQASGLAGAGLDESASPAEMLEALGSLTGDSFVKFMADTAALFAELCSGTPSAETLLLLPMRVRIRFYAWIQEEVVNPEAGPGAGTAVVRSLPPARAG